MKDVHSLGSSSSHDGDTKIQFGIRPPDSRGLRLMETTIGKITSVTWYLKLALQLNNLYDLSFIPETLFVS